jgi:nucleoside-diphosphate-sugar epimerase
VSTGGAGGGAQGDDVTTVLVTGATGFVGQRMVRWLARQPTVRAIHCLVHEGDVARAPAVDGLRRLGARIIEGDLDRPDVSATPAPAFDLLIHLAARTSTSLPLAALRVNDLGIHHLLDWAGERSVGTRFVLASTIGVMDRSGPCRGPLREDSPCTPGTPYSVTKLRGEQILRDRAERDGFSWTIVRLPTVYGPGQMPGGLFDRLMTMTARRSLLGRLDWPGRTSVIHVDDIARIVWTLGRDPRAANVLLCVASEEALTVGEIARLVGQATGHPLHPIRPPAFVWSAVRWVAWNRPLRALMARMPPRLWLPFWRLGLIADDGFWYDTSRLRAIYRDPIMMVPEGLQQMLDEAAGSVRVPSGANAR